MSRWIVLGLPVSTDEGVRTLAEFDGSPEEAEQALLQAANTFEHDLWKVRRREVFRCSDRSYFIRIHGRVNTRSFVIQLAELVHDSATRPTT
ncbi:hypothetical protein [Streptomyces sp. NPDC101115]|uniref:hypothetical protein n=1 Tax=Streptomyces sp. NPDC101115 TaxID=3366106 RepID=UPI0037FFDCEA